MLDLYTVNKAMYANVEPITDFSGVEKLVQDYLLDKDGKYFLLLNNEKHYYTVFAYTGGTYGQMTAEVVDIVRNLGPLKDAFVNDNGAIEFWIEYDGEVCMFVLFDYTMGVIEV